MKRLFLLAINLLLIPSVVFAECYLTIDDQKIINEQIATQVASLELSRYIEPISEIPPIGISEGDCQYKLTLTDSGQGFLMLIKGPKLSSYAESTMTGLQGFQQALFKTIIREYPEHKKDICLRNQSILKAECEPVVENKLPEQTDLTVLDHSTGLIWQKGEAGKMDWKQATAYCDNLNLDKFDDWRLPDDQEIKTTSKLNPLFPELNQSYYWSSTVDRSDKDYALGYSVTNNSLFSDWIKNRYYVRCVRGEKAVITTVPPDQVDTVSTNEPIQIEEPVAETTGKDPTGIRWVVGPTYFSGLSDIVDIYIHNLEELGYSKGEESSGYSIAPTFNPYWQMESGLRIGAGVGPVMSVLISAGDEEYSFFALPVNVNAGYTLTNGLFFRGGLSFLNASGEFVTSESLGLLGAVGMEFNRKRALSLGVEVGMDISAVKIEKYDCSDVSNPSSFSACDKETKTVQPIGFMVSMLFAF